MDLPDESQWDETTCDLAICQHPQCWATIRRIERGHPRILGSPCKIPLDINDKLPMLTVVNISNSCFQAKRHPHHHFSGFSFTKPHSLMSQRSKFDSKFQGRPWKDLPDKDFPNRSSKVSHRLKKLPVLNLNETQLPCPQDANHMVVIWIPKESEEHVGPAEKYTVPSQDGKKKRKKSTVKDKSSLLFPGKQDVETRLRAPGIVVPPGSPVHLFEQQISKFLPFSNQSDTLPQDLLSDLLSAEGKTTPCPEMKTQLAMLKKKPPLEKSPPDSAISAKMLLSVHHLNLQGGSRGLRARCLQTPALRYPDYSKRFYYSLKLEGQRKQQQQRQQQRKLKTPAKKQGTKRKSKSGPGSQSTSHKRLGSMVCDPCHGHRTLPGQEDDKKQEQQKQQKKKVAPLKQDSTERPQTAYAQSDLDSFPNATLSKTETTNEDEVVLGAQEKTPKDLSASTPRTSRNPEPKRLQTLQSTDHEGEENQLSGAQREESLEEEAEGITGAALVHSRCLGI